MGVENALFEPQLPAFSWECLAQPCHYSKAIREHHIQNCFLNTEVILSEPGCSGCLLARISCAAGQGGVARVLLLPAFSPELGGTQMALLESGSMCKEDLSSHCA